MNVKEIKELVDLVAKRGLAGLEVERAGFRLRIEGPRADAIALPRPLAPEYAAHVAAVPVPLHAAALAPVPVAGATLPAPPPKAADEGLHVITSPIVGTFYRAANPDADPFVKPGDEVEKGKTLCIVEAMKLMNEIEADVSGTIVEVYPKNGQPVEFGEKLFAIQPR